MERKAIEQFIAAALRFRKVDLWNANIQNFHLGELIVMSSICESGRCGSGRLDIPDIQNRLHISKPAISQILTSLERKGCIIRTVNPKDRRTISVFSTPEGEYLLKKAMQYYEGAFTKVVARFGAENLQEMTRLMEEFLQAVQQIEKLEME